ncbi:MAG: GNAT family N-acetyltransferase [Candidatus Bruticola sp.]
MTQYVRAVSFWEMKDIYEKYSKITFPPEELEPWDKVESLCAQNRYLGWGLFNEEEELCSYAFFSISPHGLYLLNMLETRPDKRGLGYGKQILKKLKEDFASHPIFIEVEAPETAANEAEKIMRKRRLNFYYRLGACDTSIRASLGGVLMYILVVNKEPFELNIQEVSQELSLHYLDIYNPTSRIL